MKVLVTGGCGYVGNRLILQLLRQNKVEKVHVLDVRQPDQSKIPDNLKTQYKEKVTVFVGDICDKRTVQECCNGMNAVFHIASFGMSGREMMQREKTRRINVEGTQNLIDACIEMSVSSLIYTSTYNVVFGGQPLPNQDESTPYFPLDKHPDEYSRTKAIAEQLVLNSNGKTLKNGKTLSTCALRPAAIYGEGEERHLPRIISLLRRGLVSFTIGSPENKVDFVYVENLVHAHILALETLTSKSVTSPAAGKPYFISDQQPINNFLFFKPLWEAMGYSYPKISIPTGVMYYIAFIIEMIHRFATSLGVHFQPLMIRAEVFKVGVTHYFNPAKPQKELGYYPIVDMKEGQRRMITQWVEDEKRWRQQNPPSSFGMLWIILLFVFVLIAWYYNT